MFLQSRYDLSYCGSFLSDCNIDTDYIFAFLVQNGIQCNGSLTCLSVTDDQLTLATADREHGVNGKNTCFQRNCYRFSLNDPRCRILYRTIPVCLNLAFTIDRCSQSIYNPSDKSVTYRHTCLFLGSCHLCSFFDSCIFTEQDTSDAVCTDILNHTFQTILKGYNLAIHSMINTMYRGDTISYGDDCSYFLVLADFVIILNFFFQNRNDFIWIHCSQLLFTSVSISVLNCYNVRGDSSRTLCLRQKE